MSLNFLSYKDTILKTKRGNSHGVFSNAKPIYVMSIIDAIGEGVIVGNKIPFECEQLISIYKNNYKYVQDNGDVVYRANSNYTPYSLPYFHLNAESYYHIAWKEGVVPPKQASSPSSKYLRENVKFAYLDEALWNLLQSAEVRYDMKQAIIQKFLITEQ